MLPHQHSGEQVTDMAGVYSAAKSSGVQPRRPPASISETHWKIEADRRAINDLIEAITKVLSREKPETWSLAAPADIHQLLVKHLPSVYRERLTKVLPKDLVRTEPKEVIAHFLEPHPAFPIS